MKRLLLGVFLAMGTALFASNDASASLISQTSEDGIVVGIKPMKIPPIKPKQVVADDITAEYNNGVLVLMFNADLGDADIVVSNLATGDSWSDSFSGYGSTTIILSGDSGYYTIDITTDSGSYYGSFEL